jgi:hypothetical protein
MEGRTAVFHLDRDLYELAQAPEELIFLEFDEKLGLYELMHEETAFAQILERGLAYSERLHEEAHRSWILMMKSFRNMTGRDTVVSDEEVEEVQRLQNRYTPFPGRWRHGRLFPMDLRKDFETFSERYLLYTQIVSLSALAYAKHLSPLWTIEDFFLVFRMNTDSRMSLVLLQEAPRGTMVFRLTARERVKLAVTFKNDEDRIRHWYLDLGQVYTPERASDLENLIYLIASKLAHPTVYHSFSTYRNLNEFEWYKALESKSLESKTAFSKSLESKSTWDHNELPHRRFMKDLV